MSYMLSIWTEKEHVLSTLADFDKANDFSSEEWRHMFLDWAMEMPHMIGGGAATQFMVKPYSMGDEDLTLIDIFREEAKKMNPSLYEEREEGDLDRAN